MPDRIPPPRPLRPEDAATVAELIRAAFSALEAAVDPPPSALRETADSVAAQLDGGAGAGIWLARALAGAVLWREQDCGLYVCRLAVLPAHRGRGIAAALLTAAERDPRRRGLLVMRLSTRLALAGNRRLFARCGFREVRLQSHPGYDRPTFVDLEKALAEPVSPI